MRRLTTEKAAAIARMFDEGLDRSAIAERLDVSLWTVGAIVTAYRHRKCPPPSPEWSYCPHCGLNLNCLRYQQTKKHHKEVVS